MGLFGKGRKRLWKLQGLRITRIATVDVGDNPPAQIKMYKSANDDESLATLAKWKRLELEREGSEANMGLTDYEVKVRAISAAVIRRYPDSRATLTSALGKCGFPTSVLPSATEVSKTEAVTFCRGDVESLMGAIDDPTFTGANRLLYAIRDDALPDPKVVEVEKEKPWSEFTLQQRAELALEVLAAEKFSKLQYFPDHPSKQQCYLAAAESKMGRILYKALSSRGTPTVSEWLESQNTSAPSGELTEVAKLLRSTF